MSRVLYALMFLFFSSAYAKASNVRVTELTLSPDKKLLRFTYVDQSVAVPLQFKYGHRILAVAFDHDLLIFATPFKVYAVNVSPGLQASHLHAVEIAEFSTNPLRTKNVTLEFLRAASPPQTGDEPWIRPGDVGVYTPGRSGKRVLSFVVERNEALLRLYKSCVGPLTR